MLPAMLVEPRDLLFDGAFNLRDLGGLPAAGGRKVRRCTVYRSGELTHLGPDGFDAVRRLGLAVVIDLRTTVEIERRGRLDWEALKVTYRHVSLVEAAVGESGAYPPDIPEDWLRHRYEEIVDTRAERVARVLTLLSWPGATPAIVQCTAGKDRTGVVSALLLALLGVPDDEIATDYALSAPAVAARGELADVPAPVLAARPETMVEFLTSLRERHGSIEGLILHLGVGPDTVVRLRSLLLE